MAKAFALLAATASLGVAMAELDASLLRGPLDFLQSYYGQCRNWFYKRMTVWAGFEFTNLTPCNRFPYGCPAGESMTTGTYTGFWGWDTGSTDAVSQENQAVSRCNERVACRSFIMFQQTRTSNVLIYLSTQTAPRYPSVDSGTAYKMVAGIKDINYCPCPAGQWADYSDTGVCRDCSPAPNCTLLGVGGWSSGYMPGGCKTTSDSVCDKCTEPSAGEYTSSVCTQVQNTAISVCTACTGGDRVDWYFSKPCIQGSSTQAGSNGECTECTCPPGTWATSGCTGSTPPDCKGTCAVCIFGTSYMTQPCTLRANAKCELCTICPVASYYSTVCTRSSSSACTACDPLSYKSRNSREVRTDVNDDGTAYTFTCQDGMGMLDDLSVITPAGPGALVLFNDDGAATISDTCVRGSTTVLGGWSSSMRNVASKALQRLTGQATAISNAQYNNVSLCYDCYTTRELWQPYMAGPIYDRNIRELEFQCVPGYEPVIPVALQSLRAVGAAPVAGVPLACNITSTFARCVDVTNQLADICAAMPLGAYASSDECAVHRDKTTGVCSILSYGVSSASHRMCQPDVLDETGALVVKKCYALGGNVLSVADSVVHGASPLVCGCKGIPGAHQCTPSTLFTALPPIVRYQLVTTNRTNCTTYLNGTNVNGTIINGLNVTTCTNVTNATIVTYPPSPHSYGSEAWVDNGDRWTVHTYSMPTSQWLFDPASPENRGQVLLSLQPYFRLIDGSLEQFYRVTTDNPAADLINGKLMFRSDNTDIELVVLVVDDDGVAIRLDEDVDLWYGSSIALFEKNPDAVASLAITRSTGSFKVKMRFRSVFNSTVGAREAYWSSLPGKRWNNVTGPVLQQGEFMPQWGLRFEWLYRKCAAGEYQVGDTCYTCGEGKCSPLASQVAFNNGTTPCRTCQCGGEDGVGGCRKCSTTCGCDVMPDNCLIQDKCYVRFDTRSPREGCIQCRPELTQGSWSALTDPTATCDDGDLCTAGDSCASGICKGEPLPCLSFNLTGHVTQACEVCGGNDGCLPDPAYGGCVAVDPLDPDLRTCGCNIDGVCYPHGSSNPSNFCEECNVALDPVAWSAKPPVECDDGLMCTHGDRCQDRTCTGIPYSCDAEGPCLASTACNGKGTCDFTYRPPTTMCAAGDGVCQGDRYCNGVSVQCPPKPALLPVITPGNITVMLADMTTPVEHDGSFAESGSPYLDRLYLSLEDWTVACGTLNFTVGWYTDQAATLGCSAKTVDSLLSRHGAPFASWVVGDGSAAAVNLASATAPEPGRFGAAFEVPLLTVVKDNGFRTLDVYNTTGVVADTIPLLSSSWVVPVVKARNILGQEVATCLGNQHRRVVVDDQPPVPRTVRILNPFVPDDGVTSYYSHSGSTLSFTWLPFTTPSRSSFGGALKYEWAVGRWPGGEEMAPFSYAGIGAGSASTAGYYGPLPHGVPMYITVRGYNRVGRAADLHAGPFVLDATPAVGCVAYDGPQTTGRTPVQSSYISDNSAPLTVTVYSCVDRESGISAMTSCWGTVAGRCDVTAPVTQAVSPSQTELTVSQTFKKVPGVRYIATVRVISGSGAAVVLSSPGTTVDVTPPDDVRVVIPAFVNNAQLLAVEWTYTELESSVVSAAVDIMGSNGVAVVPSQTVAGTSAWRGATIAVPRGVLTQGATYSLCVLLTNAVNLTSVRACASTTLDTVPVALPGIVMVHPGDVAGPPIVAVSRPDIGFAARWDAPVASISGIRGISARLTASGSQRLPKQVSPSAGPGAVQVVPWTAVTAGSLALFNPPTATPGWTYWITVSIVSGSGLVTQATAGVFVGSGGAFGVGSVWVPIPSRPTQHTGFWGSESSLAVAWNNLVDPVTGPAEYHVAVGTCTPATVSSVFEWTSIGDASGETSTVLNGISLAGDFNTTFCVSVRGTSNTGQIVNATSLPFRLDVTPPGAPTGMNTTAVLEYDAQPSGRSTAELDYIPSNNTVDGQPAYALTVTWPAMNDGESGMDAYFLCRSTVPGCSGALGVNVLPSAQWKANLGRFSFTQAVTGVQADVTLYTIICGMNKGGLTTCMTSDGVQPMPVTANVGFITIPSSTSPVTLLPTGTASNAAYVSHAGASNALRLRLVGFSIGPAVQAIRLDVGTAPGLRNVYTALPIGKTTDFSVPAPPGNFTEGGQYCFSVTVVLSETNVKRHEFSPCVSLDFSAPPVFVPFIGQDAGSTAPVVAWFDRTQLGVCLNAVGDVHSGVASVTAAVGTAPSGPANQTSLEGKFFIAAEEDVPSLAGIPPGPSSPRCFTMTRLSLRSGVRYVVAVTVINGAGLATRATSASFYVDDTPPSVFDVLQPTSASAAAMASALAGSTMSPAVAANGSALAAGGKYLPVHFTAPVDADAEFTGVQLSYFAALGSQPGWNDVVDFRPVVSITKALVFGTAGDRIMVIAGAIDVVNVSLTAARAYLVVRASSSAGLMDVAYRQAVSSSVVLLDPSAPVFPSVPKVKPCTAGRVDVPAADQPPVTAVCDATTVSVVWEPPTTTLSSLMRQTVCLQTYDKLKIECVDVGPLARTAQLTGQALPEGSNYTVLLTATITAGVSASAESARFVVDTQPPVFPTGSSPVVMSRASAVDSVAPSRFVLPDTESPGVNTADMDTAVAAVAVVFRAAVDSSSGVDRYEVAFGSVPGGADLLPMTQATTQRSFISTGMVYQRLTLQGVRLVQGVALFATVRAVDRAGNAVLLTSSTAPTAVVRPATSLGMSVTNAAGRFQTRATTVNLTLTHAGGLTATAAAAIADVDASNPAVPTGIAAYHVCISSGGASDVWCNVRPAGSCWLEVPVTDRVVYTVCSGVNLQLVDGTEYIALFRVTSRAGFTTTVSSAPFVVDSVAPSLGTAALPLWVGSNSSVAVTWSRFTDAISGVASVELQVWLSKASPVTPPALSRLPVTPWTRVPPDGAMDVAFYPGAASNFSHQDSFYVVARACDVAGRCINGTVSSSQSLYDATAPVARTDPPVRIVPDMNPLNTDTHLQYLMSTTTVHATWGTWVDPEAPIVRYMVAVGVAPGGQQLLPYTDVGLATFATLTGMSLQDGMDVYVTVMGVTAAGLASTASSLASRVITEPPLPFTVQDGALLDVADKYPALAQTYAVMRVMNQSCTELGSRTNRSVTWCQDVPTLDWNTTAIAADAAGARALPAGVGYGLAMDYLAGNPEWDVDLHIAPFGLLGCHWTAPRDLNTPISHISVLLQRQDKGGTAWTTLAHAPRIHPADRSVTMARPLPILQGRERCVVNVVNTAGLNRTVVSDGVVLDRPKVTVSGTPRFLSHPESTSPDVQKGDVISFTWERVFTAGPGVIQRYDVGLLVVGGRAQQYLASGWDPTLDRRDWPTTNCTNQTVELVCVECTNVTANRSTLCANTTLPANSSVTVCKNVSVSLAMPCPTPPVYTPVPDAAGWISYGPSVFTAQLIGLTLPRNATFVPVVRALTASGEYTDLSMGRSAVRVDDEPMEPNSGVLAIAQSSLAFQDGRTTVGLSRLGYLADSQLLSRMVTMVNGSAENVTIPDGAVWSPILTANIPLVDSPLALDGQTCPYTNRPFEVNVAAERVGSSYRTVTGALPLNATMAVDAAWIARATADLQSGLLHGSMCAPGSFRTVFGVCAACPPGSFKSTLDDSSSCQACGDMTWWKLRGQQVGYDSITRSFTVSVAAAQQGDDVALSTSCACLDYLTQTFDEPSGACVCQPGRYLPSTSANPDLRLDPVAPKAPDGRISNVSDTDLCALCPAGTYKSAAGDDLSLCLPCGSGMVSTPDGTSCQCTDSNRVWDGTANACVCKAGLFESASGSCVECLGSHRYKDGPGDDQALCRRCPFGTVPTADKTACVSDVPGMVYEHRAGASDNKGYCPAGTTLEYGGMEDYTVGGLAWVYRDPIYGFDDWVRSEGAGNGVPCYLPTLDPESGDNYYDVAPGVRVWDYEAVDGSLWATRGMRAWDVGKETTSAYLLPAGGAYNVNLHGPPTSPVPQWGDFNDLFRRAYPRHRATPAFKFWVEWLYNGESTMATIAAQRAYRVMNSRKEVDAAMGRVITAFSLLYPNFQAMSDAALDELVAGCIDKELSAEERPQRVQAFLNDVDMHMFNYTTWRGIEVAFDAALIYYKWWSPHSTLGPHVPDADGEVLNQAYYFGQSDLARALLSWNFNRVHKAWTQDQPDNIDYLMQRLLTVAGMVERLAQGAVFDGDVALVQMLEDLPKKVENLAWLFHLLDFTKDNDDYKPALEGMATNMAGQRLRSPNSWARWAASLQSHISNVEMGAYQEFPASLGATWTPSAGPGIYRLSRTYAGCSVVRQRPVVRCTPCAAGLVQPKQIVAEAAPFQAKRRNEGTCSVCPAPSVAMAQADGSSTGGGSVNYFLVANLTSLHLDWSGLWQEGDVSGPRQYAYALGSVPGGAQYQSLTPVVPPLATRVSIPLDSATINQLGLQHGAPIYATIQALDVAGNVAVFQDTNPVVWDPNGPLPGDVKDASLDDYTPPVVPGLAYLPSTSPKTKIQTFKRSLATGEVPEGDDSSEDQTEGMTAATQALLLSSARERRASQGRSAGKRPARGGSVLAIDTLLNPEDAYERMYHGKAQGQGQAGQDGSTSGHAGQSAGRDHILAVHAGRRAQAHARRLQFGTVPTVNVTNGTDARLAAIAAYDWRDDGTLTDLTFVPDLDFQTDPTRLSVSYEAFGALASGIAGISYCAGSQPYACDIVPATMVEGVDGNLPTAYSFDITRLSLAVPSTVYVTLSAASGSGIVATVTTDGIKVDNRAPYSLDARVVDTGSYALLPATAAARGSGAAAEELPPAVDIDCDAAMAGVGAAWSGFVAPLGVDRYEWCVGTRPGRCDVLPWVSVGLATSVYNATLLLPEGAVVFATVRVFDRIGQTQQAVSDGVRLLAALPVVPEDAATLPVNGTTTAVLNATQYMAAVASGKATLPAVANSTAGLAMPVVREHRWVCDGAPSDLLHLTEPGAMPTSGNSEGTEEVAGLAPLLG